MSTLDALELDHRIDEFAGAPAWLLVGEDAGLRSWCVRLLVGRLAPREQPGSTVRRFEGSVEAREVFDELNTIPFLGLAGRRVAVVEDGDAFLESCWEPLARYLRAPAGTATLILCLRRLGDAPPSRGGARAEAWRAAYRVIRESCALVDCSSPAWREAREWVGRRAAAMGVKLTRAAVAALVEAVGPNLDALDSELEKLAAYVSPRPDVSEEDVAEMVPQARPRTVFELGDAVAGRNGAEALRLCEQLLLRGESREGVIAILAWEVRQLWQTLRLASAGASEAEVARRTGVPRFVARRRLAAAARLSEELLARQLRILCRADVESKTTSLGESNELVWLQSLLTKLCAA